MRVELGAAIVVVAVTAIVLVRVYNRVRSRSAARAHVAHPMDDRGILEGAEPLHLIGDGDRGLLLIHGFNDTPQSVAHLARALHAHGWTVHAPLLPHHGRGGEELAQSGDAREWIAAARNEWQSLRDQVARPVLCGQSMGGAIALILAAESPPEALVLLAPYLTMGRVATALASMWPLWQLAMPKLLTDPERGLHDPVARASALGSWWFTPRLVHELRRVVRDARQALPRERAPTLVIHARSDYRIPSRAATRAFEQLGAPDKTLLWSERGGHVLAADSGRDAVAGMVGEWLNARLPAR